MLCKNIEAHLAMQKLVSIMKSVPFTQRNMVASNIASSVAINMFRSLFLYMFNRQINRTANRYEVVYFFITFTVTVILPVTFITANQIVQQNITPMKNLIAQLGKS